MIPFSNRCLERRRCGRACGSKRCSTASADRDEILRILDGELNGALAEPLSRVAFETLADRAWEREWLKDFRPMRFGQRLWICPGGQQPDAEQLRDRPAPVLIELDPGLAFGTGTHPTTALCLEWLDSAAVAGTRVIDFGCGSGILAIAAAKLGAAEVLAIDIDPQALLATHDNAERNGVAQLITARLVDGEAESHDAPADILLANILAGPLESLAPTFAAASAPAAGWCCREFCGIRRKRWQAPMRRGLILPPSSSETTGRASTACAARLHRRRFRDDPSMLTQCPSCQTTFRVTSEILRVAHGQVRCGRCQTQFDALERLIEETDDGGIESGQFMRPPRAIPQPPPPPGQIEVEEPVEHEDITLEGRHIEISGVYEAIDESGQGQPQIREEVSEEWVEIDQDDATDRRRRRSGKWMPSLKCIDMREEYSSVADEDAALEAAAAEIEAEARRFTIRRGGRSPSRSRKQISRTPAYVPRQGRELVAIHARSPSTKRQRSTSISRLGSSAPRPPRRCGRCWLCRWSCCCSCKSYITTAPTLARHPRSARPCRAFMAHSA